MNIFRKSLYLSILHEILFWVHVGMILLGLFIGLFLSLPVVFVLLVLYRIHLRVFRECVFSRLQKYLKAIPEDLSFFQFALQRLFSMRISRQQNQRVHVLFALFCLLIAVIY